MSKPPFTPIETTQSPAQHSPKPGRKRTKIYTFPDIEGGGPAVTVEAASLKEATELFMKGQASSLK